jgi:hypothetical protein
VKAPAGQRTAHQKVVAAPTVIAAVTVASRRATKVTGDEGSDLLVHAQFHCGVVKALQCIAHLGQQAGMLMGQEVVQVKATHRDEKKTWRRASSGER